jgi:tetratricopeptide (TPR) repeat protein
MQAVLQKQSDRLQGSSLLTHLRTLQAMMADKNKFASAFRQAEALLPALRQEAPQLVPRLARCFYWTVLETGPDDMLRYQRVFGKPADDPNFHRLQALGYEKGEDLAEAHLHWQQYEKEIAAHAENWPGDQAAHARALIWQRMGQNAASIPESRRGQRRPFDLFGLDAPQRPLHPPAEECLQKSLRLAPDLLESHEALIRHHREGKREAKAEKAARDLLKHFPDHVPTLELLSDLRRKRGNHAEALELMEQALRGNALDRRLRRKVSEAHLLLGRSHGEAGQFDEARQQFQAALDLSNGADGGLVLAHWAACEFRSGDAVKGEELVRQALAQAPAAVGIAYLFLTEVIRLKLDRTLKKRFEEDLKQGLAEPTPAGAVFLARVLAELHTGGVKYIGQKGHAQKVKTYIHKARDLDFSEAHLEELCQNLLDLEDYPKARRFADMGELRYPNNPVFPYLHALGWIHPLGRRVQPYQVVPLLQRARGLLHGQPPNERRDRMLEDIDKHLHELNPFDLNFLRGFFENLGGGPDEDFDDGDDGDEW